MTRILRIKNFPAINKILISSNKIFIFLFLLFFSFFQIYSQQCAVCTIDVTCDSVPAAPKLCPAELPQDTAGQYYDADLTFYIPQQFEDPNFGTVTLNQIDVLGVTGLPAGVDWTAYNYLGAASTSFFPPASPPASERGCAKICGTPPMPFDDSISVTVIAYVTVSGVNATQNSTFKVHLKIVPNPSGNSVFTMDNSQGCDSVTVNFTPNLQSNGNPLISYNWNFGNGDTSASEFPVKTYLTPGDFTVKCTTSVYQYVVTSVMGNAVNEDWCGDVEEPYFFGCSGDPDMFFQINSNGGITGSDTIDNTSNCSWANLNFPIEGNQFIIYFFDEDGGPPFGSPTDSLGYSTITVSGSGGTYNFSTPSLLVSGETAVNGNIVVSLQVKDTYIDSDFVHVHAPPILSPLSFSENDSICNGDSVLLNMNGGYSYQWYNDTVLLFGETDSSCFARQAGNYWVKVTNSFGCTSSSDSQNITIVPNPPKPGFIYLGNNTLKTFLSGFPLQWYFNGTLLPGATTQSYIIDSTGYYSLSATNGFCTTFSDSAYYTHVGTDEPGFINSLKIFPNPNKGEFTLTFESINLLDVEIYISDVLGRQIYSESQKDIIGVFSKNITLVSKDAGMYFLKFSTGGLIINRKIIVQ